MSIEDETIASDDEVLAAYIADGYDTDEAGVMLAALRGQLPGVIG